MDHYIDKFCREGNQRVFKRKPTRCNLTPGEQETLRRLRSRTDVIFRPADKGWAFVVWSKDLYLTEALKKAIRRTVLPANSRGCYRGTQGFGPFKQLPPSATSLVAECPRTSKFYLLAKIHKPGNPGRPTVSACACPTEKLALYLDKVTAPFVRGLESHVKDTMDIKSLYTVIPNEEGLVSLKYFLDKREVKDPPTDTLVRMAELVLTLNTFEFKGEYYK